MQTRFRIVRCSYKYHNAHLYSTGEDLNYHLYIRLDSLMDKALDLSIRGREFEARYVQEFFILLFSVFAPWSPSKPVQMKSTITYT